MISREDAMANVAYDFQDETADCEGAEDFLTHFGVPYDPAVVHVNRLHILQRFHDYLAAHTAAGDSGFDDFRHWLVQAYEDFVRSDAQTEKVFRVHQRASGIAKVPVTAIGRARS
jgi:nitrogenase-stabilizing/protective protein